MNIFVFDIETIPDIDGCRRLYDLHGLSDDDVAKAVFHKRRQQANTEFLRHHLHRVVAISAVLRTRDQFKVWSLGDLESGEQDLLERFYSGIDRYTPRLVSWNGSGFDLPVVHYRSLLYPINAEHYWESGQNDTNFRYNNYLSRFHDRHTDLMDVLAAYQPRASAPLDEIASRSRSCPRPLLAPRATGGRAKLIGSGDGGVRSGPGVPVTSTVTVAETSVSPRVSDMVTSNS
jgi:predicted PolB exonuclease-like 3'-5' exonuclease